MMTRISHYLIGCWMGLVVGLAIGQFEPGAAAPIPLPTNANTSYTWLLPMTVELHILSVEEFKSKRESPGITGFSQLGNATHRCRIYIPTNAGMIQRVPWRPELDQKYPVNWSNESAPALLAHGLMHCMIGAWHP